mmetsp:Transcript_72611/g.121138  ORF Transcript_72611/g.121138 Transcript_72611/m.121138 type:complete len:306 (+) Transcript_72611:106-1023(+)
MLAVNASVPTVRVDCSTTANVDDIKRAFTAHVAASSDHIRAAHSSRDNASGRCTGTRDDSQRVTETQCAWLRDSIQAMQCVDFRHFFETEPLDALDVRSGLDVVFVLTHESFLFAPMLAQLQPPCRLSLYDADNASSSPIMQTELLSAHAELLRYEINVKLAGPPGRLVMRMLTSEAFTRWISQLDCYLAAGEARGASEVSLASVHADESHEQIGDIRNQIVLDAMVRKLSFSRDLSRKSHPISANMERLRLASNAASPRAAVSNSKGVGSSGVAGGFSSQLVPQLLAPIGNEINRCSASHDDNK